MLRFPLRNAWLFMRWFDTVRRGKHIVAVVVTDVAAAVATGLSRSIW
jgi:hypothetical protein